MTTDELRRHARCMANLGHGDAAAALRWAADEIGRLRGILKPIGEAIRHDGRGIDLTPPEERDSWNDDAHVPITITAKEVWAVLDAITSKDTTP